MSLLVAAIALSLTAPLPAQAQLGDIDLIAACMLRHPARSIMTAADLPQPVVRALYGIAGKGQPFNSGDSLVFGLPTRRFVAAGQSGDLYLVWFEQGGSVYSRRIAYLRVVPGKDVAEMVLERSSTGFDSCRAFDDLLDGKPVN